MNSQEKRLVNIAPLEADYERYLEDLDKQFTTIPQDTNEYRNTLAKYIAHSKCLKALNNLPDETVNGSTSDGFHTFDELYYHRAVLFSVIVSVYPQLCWKSHKHSDGTMFENMFVVGINTPEGPATYHYHNDMWDLFKCKAIQKAPQWDGHTSEQAIQRIASLHKPDVAIPLTYAEALEQTKLDGAVWIDFRSGASFYGRVCEPFPSINKAIVTAYASTEFNVRKQDYGFTWVCFNTKPLYNESHNFWRPEQ